MIQRSPYHGRGSARLSRAQRAEHLAALTAPGAPLVDVLVIGGGISGVGIALDAASRGLSTVLLERDDLGAGSTGNSANTLYSGLRELSRGMVHRSRAIAQERNLIADTIAPHLVQVQPEILPLHTDVHRSERLMARALFHASDMSSSLASRSRPEQPSRQVDRSEVLAKNPGLRRDGLRGGFERGATEIIDDIRLVLAIARTAAEMGAKILTRTRVLEADGGAARVEDTETGAVHEIRARSVVNATGPWADSIDPSVTLRPSVGTFLVVKAERLGFPSARTLVLEPGRWNRWIHILPIDMDRVIIGPSDHPSPYPTPDHPVASRDTVEQLLVTVNRVLERPLLVDDIESTATGLLPMTAPTTADGRVRNLSTDSADKSSAAIVSPSPSGLLTVTGGSLTNYRLMAEQAVDRAVRIGGLRAGPCTTRVLPLRGAPRHVDSAEVTAADLAGLPASLVARFGAEAPLLVADSLLERPLEPVAPGLDITRAEFSHFVRAEGALTVEDILLRRSRLSLVAADAAAATPAAQEALDVVGAHLQRTGME